MLHAPPHRDVVDCLLNRAVDEIQPHRRGLLLPDAVHTRDGLELESRIYEWLTEEDMAGVDEV